MRYGLAFVLAITVPLLAPPGADAAEPGLVIKDLRIASGKAKANPEADEVGDVIAEMSDGSSRKLTSRAHASLPKVGTQGLVGWTYGQKQFQGAWVNDRLRIQKGTQKLYEIKPEFAFIEDWDFVEPGIAVKSRMAHGPALIEVFSYDTGKRVERIEKAFKEDENDHHLPKWAEKFAD